MFCRHTQTHLQKFLQKGFEKLEHKGCMLSFFYSTKRGRDIFQSVGSPKTKPSVLMLGNCAWPMDHPLIDLATFVYSTGLPRYGRIWTFIFSQWRNAMTFFLTKRSGKGNPFPKRSSSIPLWAKAAKCTYFHFPMMIRSLFEKYRWCSFPSWTTLGIV